jgi:hypothetical protein
MPCKISANGPPPPARRTAHETVLLAAHDAGRDGRPFTEWDLSVACWRRDHDTFAMRGYPQYPDHKRVYMEIAGKKQRSPVMLGYLRRTAPNTYVLTDLGRTQAKYLLGYGGVGIDQHAAVGEVMGSMLFHEWLRTQTAPTVDAKTRKALKDYRDIIRPLAGCNVPAPRGSTGNGPRTRKVYTAAEVGDVLSFLEVAVGEK